MFTDTPKTCTHLHWAHIIYRYASNTCIIYIDVSTGVNVYYRPSWNFSLHLTDDIDIEDAQEVEESKEKNKAQQFTAFSKQKLGKGLQALKG